MRFIKKYVVLFFALIFCMVFSSVDRLKNQNTLIDNAAQRRGAEIANRTNKANLIKLKKYYMDIYDETIMKGFPLCSFEQFCSLYEEMQLNDYDFLEAQYSSMVSFNEVIGPNKT